jgi:hypothetical protein
MSALFGIKFVRTTLIALFVIAFLPHCVYGQQDRLTVKGDPDDPSRYICDVKFATFKTPKGWRPNRSEKQTYAILTRSNETYPNVTQMISIDIGKPVAPTAALMADEFAKKWNGSVIKGSLKVDGEEGFRVKVTPNKKEVRPVDCVVVLKNKRVFMLIGGSKENKGLEKAIDDLVASWKWKE